MFGWPTKISERETAASTAVMAWAVSDSLAALRDQARNKRSTEIADGRGKVARIEPQPDGI
jgi:hypothetical protein